MAYLSQRKRGENIYLYACQNVKNSDTNKRKISQIYVGKVKENICSFKEDALHWSGVFKGTEFEDQYVKWCSSVDTQTIACSDNKNNDQHCVEQCSEQGLSADGGLNVNKGLSLNGGINLVCSSQAEKLRLQEIVYKVFDKELADKLLSLVYFCASGTRNSLSSIVHWSSNEMLPCGRPLVYDDIVEILKNITPVAIKQFQIIWGKRFTKKGLLSLNLNASNSYAKVDSDDLWTYNRDKERHTNIFIRICNESKSPMSFECSSRIDGKPYNVKNLHQSGCCEQNVVFDRSFSNKCNFRIALEGGIQFTCVMQLYKFQDLHEISLKSYQDGIFSDQKNLLAGVKLNGCPVSAITKLHFVEGNIVYDHFYCFDHLFNKSDEEITERIEQVYRRLKEGKEITDPVEDVIARICFKVEVRPEQGITVSRMLDPVESIRKVLSGFLVLRSTQFKSAGEALQAYILRNAMERRFDNLKNIEDVERLGISSEHNMRARIFIQFLAQILRSDAYMSLRPYVTRSENIKTIDDVYTVIDSLRIHKFENGDVKYEHPTEDQRMICEMFKIGMTGPEWD